MRTSQIHKRLQKLSAKIRPNGIREFTLEELCREYWRLNKRAFLALANRDCKSLRAFVDIFQREEAESVLRAKAGTRLACHVDDAMKRSPDAFACLRVDPPAASRERRRMRFAELSTTGKTGA
jgi:hypothetical protein